VKAQGVQEFGLFGPNEIVPRFLLISIIVLARSIPLLHKLEAEASFAVA